MIFLKRTLFIALFFLPFCGCKEKQSGSENNSQFLKYAEDTFENIFQRYAVEGENLMRENYPYNESYVATYLADSNQQIANQYAYLWPYSGVFSAANAIYKATKDQKYLDLIDNKILPALEEYLDTERHPFGYSSYINRAPLSDRFYDDNIWIGIDYTDLYLATNEASYLKKAEMVWNFVYSGFDNELGGGIYWVEQNRKSKHSCSNAPAVVLAVKLYLATENKDYLDKATTLYNWTNEHLQDKEDLLYYDNIALDGTVDKKKYAYNSGQMLQAATLLYNVTKEERYLNEAVALSEACYKRFFHDFRTDSGSFRILNNGDIWFSAVMVRGFVELYKVNKDATYIKSLSESLKYAWEHMKDANGLFGTNWDGENQPKEKWLLTQAAMIEMYAEFACVGCK